MFDDEKKTIGQDARGFQANPSERLNFDISNSAVRRHVGHQTLYLIVHYATFRPIFDLYTFSSQDAFTSFRLLQHAYRSVFDPLDSL